MQHTLYSIKSWPYICYYTAMIMINHSNFNIVKLCRYLTHSVIALRQSGKQAISPQLLYPPPPPGSPPPSYSTLVERHLLIEIWLSLGASYIWTTGVSGSLYVWEGWGEWCGGRGCSARDCRGVGDAPLLSTIVPVFVFPLPSMKLLLL